MSPAVLDEGAEPPEAGDTDGGGGVNSSPRTCLFIDMAYSLAELRQRGHFQFFDARRSGGYFEKVIGLHPLADRVTKMDKAIERHRFDDRQEVIEGRSEALPWPKWLLPLNVIISQRRLLRYICAVVRSERISVISATEPLYGGLFGTWVKKRTGRPLVVHLYANFDLNYATSGKVQNPKLIRWRFVEKWLIRHVFRRADLVAAGSHTMADFAVAQGVPQDRIVVFRVGKYMTPEHRVPPAERARLTSAERDEFGIAGTDKLLLTVARLEREKKVDHALRAFSVVVREHPDALLLLAGKGAERDNLEALARELGIHDRVRFLGLTNQDVLSRLEPDCVILSPLTGMALLETSMAGAPPVAYDLDSSVADLVESGVTGELIAPGDWQAMGRAASRILSDPKERKRLGKAIRERAQFLSDPEQIYAVERAAYEGVIAQCDSQARQSLAGR
jgi:glycosyltransferase involved in cell wall biosynthesis